LNFDRRVFIDVQRRAVWEQHFNTPSRRSQAIPRDERHAQSGRLRLIVAIDGGAPLDNGNVSRHRQIADVLCKKRVWARGKRKYDNSRARESRREPKGTHRSPRRSR
jgi:hypothetical protein